MSQTNSSSTVPDAVDLTNCDREQIQHINAIQPIGFLIAVSSDWRISRVSANIADFLGLRTDLVLRAPLHDVFLPDAIHIIRNQLSLLLAIGTIERSFAVQLQENGAKYDLAVHKSGELIIIEAEPSVPITDFNAGAMVRSMLSRINSQPNFMQEAARLVQALTGFDRVMIYRFHPDGSGEVIAERVRSGVESFLGLRYPATDIPLQARALLVRNPVRVLIDITAAPIPLVLSAGEPDTPLDLSMSVLRAHSSMHTEYLLNMGVGSTMTISLIREGRLWGLISCHHMAPWHVGFEQRTAAELFAEILSLLIEQRERAAVVENTACTKQLREQLVATVVINGTTTQTMAQLAGGIKALLPCDGIAVYADGVVTVSGDTPTVDECETLRGFLGNHQSDQIYATSNLGLAFAPARDFVDRAAGMLVIPISRSTGNYLVFFRHERPHAVTWAGKPDKLVVVGPDGPQLTPRKSFAAWRELVRGQSAPWTPFELGEAELLRATLFEVFLQQAGMTETENRAATQKQELLIAELNHRVRNILGLISSLVAQSRLTAPDLDTFASVLGDRVHALARAHDQITAKQWGPGSLTTLISAEVSAFLGGERDRVSFDGPSVLIAPQGFLTLALVVHELLTNAVKYGALSGESGQLVIAWDLDADGNLLLNWHEIGGPPVVVPTKRGFGSTIIYRMVPHELGGDAAIDYAPGGLLARFVIPAKHFELVGNTEIEPLGNHHHARQEARLDGTVLLVEDNMIIALEAEDMLLALGARNVLFASNVAQALRLLTIETPSFALLDINLGSEMSWPIAARLRELGVRYAFATGYSNQIDVPLEHRSAPIISKPYTRDSLSREISDS